MRCPSALGAAQAAPELVPSLVPAAFPQRGARPVVAATLALESAGRFPVREQPGSVTTRAR